MYDPETGLYYLQARYYDPDTCRFISPDAQLNDSSHILGANMYAYCYNCPIMYADYDGREAIAICAICTICIVGLSAALLMALPNPFENANVESIPFSYDYSSANHFKYSSLIENELGRIAKKYGLLKCVQAADEIKNPLKNCLQEM